MYKNDLSKERVQNQFKLLSEELSLLYPKELFEIYIVGGVPLMLYSDIKKSSDIDVWMVSDKRMTPLLNKYFMNNRAFGMSMSFSADMESRFYKSNFSCNNLNVYVASLEDIVASKLIVNRDKDFEDITNIDVILNVDYDLLDKIITNELSIDLNEVNYRQLIRTYNKWLDYVDDVLNKSKGDENGWKKTIS